MALFNPVEVQVQDWYRQMHYYDRALLIKEYILRAQQASDKKYKLTFKGQEITNPAEAKHIKIERPNTDFRSNHIGVDYGFSDHGIEWEDVTAPGPVVPTAESDQELAARLEYILGRYPREQGKELDALAERYGLKRQAKQLNAK